MQDCLLQLDQRWFALLNQALTWDILDLVIPYWREKWTWWRVSHSIPVCAQTDVFRQVTRSRSRRVACISSTCCLVNWIL